ncbi:MAG TPA: hypothetical protein GXX17_00605 [Clostridiales bacterium]|nr:hypothetical protein [Clostridiales bacterium]
MSYRSNSNTYIAVIGDIINSKKIPNRNEVQNKLKAILKQINQKYGDDIESNFMITLGDEFQGLLNSGKNLIKIISEIEFAMFPIKIRFGIGIGAIETEINKEMPFGADGPAYHNARQMIEELKSRDKKYEANHSNIMICSQGNNAQADTLLNTILSLCSAIKAKWTPRQIEIISCYIESGKNQLRAAEKLGINQSSVNRSLNYSDFYTYEKAMDVVNSVLSEIKEQANV